MGNFTNTNVAECFNSTVQRPNGKNLFIRIFLGLLIICISLFSSAQTTYTLITSTSELTAGSKYLIVSRNTAGSGFAVGYQNTNNRPQASVTVTSGLSISVTPATANTQTTTPFEFTLGGTSGAWTLFDAANSGYLRASGTGSNNWLTLAAPTGTWTISFSGGAAVIQCTNAGGTRDLLRYNSGSSLFSCYNTGQAAVYLYKASSIPNLSTNGTTSLGFGNQIFLTNSTSQIFNLSGTFLTGAPGNITVNASNSNFEVSNNNSSWGSSTLIGYNSSTLTSTPVYVRFSPQSTGLKSGNITFSGAGVSTPPTIALSGTGILASPVANTATGLTSTGFNANWSLIGGATSYLLDVSTYSTFATPSVTTTDLIISEYVEGSSSNKYIELFNGTGAPVDLSDYQLILYANGSTSATNTATLSGTLLDGSTIVYQNSSASAYSGSATNNTAVNFNGDDAIALFKISTSSNVDIIGRIGEDPGTEWTSGVLSTLDKTLVRKSSVTSGVTANPSSGFPTLATEWDVYNTDDVTHLGAHSFSSSSPSFVTGYNSLNVGNVLTYPVSGLTPNTTYYYRLRASDANGVSANSNVITVTTPATFRTTGSGNFSSIGSWEYFNGSSYVPATQVPATIDDITVQSGHILSLDQNFTVGAGKTFTVASGGSLIINDNATLDMADNTGTINFNGQPVTVKSTATGTGSIGQVPGTLSGATNVTLERFIPQNATRGWRLLAANTSGQTIRNAWQEGGATVSDLGTQITGGSALFGNDAAAQAAGFDKRTPGSSILFYDQPNDSLNALASTTVNIATHPAYFLYIRGDRSGDFTTNTTLKATTLRSTGTIVSGNQSLNILPVSTNNTNGFNILGNPFASAIDMRTVMATRSNTTDISEDFQVWDPKVLGTYGLGGFQTFTRTGANYVVTPGGGSYQANNGPTAEYNNIESGAGFVVTNTGGSTGTITIAENAKVSASREVQRPAGTLALPGFVKTNLYAMNTGSPVLADGNLVLVDDSYSNSIDIADARKIPNFGENFGIEKLGNLLAVEKRTAFVESDIIAFSMSKLKAVAYRLEIIAEAVDAGLVAYLDDSYTKIQTPLSNQGTTTYDFTVNADAASATANRFQIVFKSLGGALPVSFIRFAATKANNDVVLDWKVGNQQGVSKYEVEKSADGRTFVTVASVSAVDGQDVYNWTDNNVVEPKLYYRVRAVEADGSSKLTDIASIVTNKQAGIKLITNLARANEAVKLEFVGQQAGKYNIRLVNSLGQVMYRNFISYVGGNGYQQFTIPSQLAGGTYQLEIVTPGKTKSVQRLVIQ